MAATDTDSVVMSKKDNLGLKIQEREDERLRKAAQRREEMEKTASKSEKTQYFMETLTAGVAAIKKGLATAPDQEKDSLPAYFDSLSLKLADIQKFVTDSAMFLSSYDLAQKQQQLNDLQSEIATSRNNLIPKSKFAFRNRKKQSTPTTSSPTPPVEKPDSIEKLSAANLAANEYRITNLSNENLKILPENVDSKDVVITSITDCTVSVLGAPSAMHFTNLSNSTILAGPCSRSIFIEKCTDCVLVLACQQLRIHEAVNCTFFIHVTSKAIIEDSKDLRFAPYQLTYDGIAEHYKDSGLNQQINNWYDVDDFNWLVKDKQSPNWSILPEDERISHQS